MGIEGPSRRGLKELAAIEDQDQREQLYRDLVAQLYKRGKAVNIASYLEIDAVIDPSETRKWIMRGIKSAATGKKQSPVHNYVDPW